MLRSGGSGERTQISVDLADSLLEMFFDSLSLSVTVLETKAIPNLSDPSSQCWRYIFTQWSNSNNPSWILFYIFSSIISNP